MLEKLTQIDQHLFDLLNGWGNPFTDHLMRGLSSTWIWIPVYLIITFILIRKNPRKGFLGVLILLLTLLLTEQLSVQAFKEVFERLRPCHDPDMKDKIRLVADACGGPFGFVSTHATNAAGLLLVSSRILKNKAFFFSLLTWVLLVSYSRIYVGVHFPGDILGGFALGLVVGWFTFALYKYLLKAPIFND